MFYTPHHQMTSRSIFTNTFFLLNQAKFRKIMNESIHFRRKLLSGSIWSVESFHFEEFLYRYNFIEK